MRTSNPVLGSDTFRGFTRVTGTAAMTIQGTVNKSLILLAVLIISSMWTWRTAIVSGPQAVMPFMYVGIFGGLVAAIATSFKREWAPVTAPMYAVFEGFFLGGISSLFEASYPGVVFQAVTLTFGTLLAMLIAYRTGLIKATERFKLGVMAATGGIFLVYMASMVLGFFGVHMSFVSGGGSMGTLFSLAVVAIAALNLVLDFDLIEQGAAGGAPKYMEWFGAFALLVTLIWLYIEILRLLARLRSRE